MPPPTVRSGGGYLERPSRFGRGQLAVTDSARRHGVAGPSLQAEAPVEASGDRGGARRPARPLPVVFGRWPQTARPEALARFAFIPRLTGRVARRGSVTGRG